VEIADNTRRNAEPVIHARKNAVAVALCGLGARSLWTNQRCAVSCPGCIGEIARRLARTKVIHTAQR
jgi:hypothetical protein